MERISKGVLVGVGESAGKGMMFVSMGYKGKFEFVKNVNYEITISVDLGRLSSFQPDNSDPFTDLAMLRILNLDFIRVEKQAANPLPGLERRQPRIPDIQSPFPDSICMLQICISGPKMHLASPSKAPKHARRSRQSLTSACRLTGFPYPRFTGSPGGFPLSPTRPQS